MTPVIATVHGSSCSLKLSVTCLVQVEVPKRIVLNAPIVTKDNVDKYLPLGFQS